MLRRCLDEIAEVLVKLAIDRSETGDFVTERLDLFGCVAEVREAEAMAVYYVLVVFIVVSESGDCA